MLKNKKLVLIPILLLIGLSFNFNVINVNAVAGEYPYFEEYNWDFSNASEYTLSDGLEIVNGEVRLEYLDITPYAYYQLNESSGTNATDSSGNERHGTTSSMVDGDWVAGKINNSLTFDGTGEYVNLGSIAGFSRTDAFSVESWYKTSDTGNLITIISKRDVGGDARGWSLSKDDDDTVQFWLVNDAGTNEIGITHTGYSAGVWQHVIATYDGSGVNTGLEIYINANSSGTTRSGTLSAIITNSANAQISGRSGTNYDWDGEIDEVVIYEYELNQSHVDMRYNVSSGTYKMSGYDPAHPEMTLDIPFSTEDSLRTFTETVIKPTGTDICYQASIDNGITWKWYNGTEWTVSNGSHAESIHITEMNENIDSLGVGDFKLKVKPCSNGDNTPILENINVNWYIDPINHNAILNNGNGFASSTTIPIELYCDYIVEMRFKVGSSPWASWENYSTTKTLDISSGISGSGTSSSGLHTSETSINIYIQFRNGGTESEVLSGTIIYTGGTGGNGGGGGGGGGDDDDELVEVVTDIRELITIWILVFAGITMIMFLRRNMRKNPKGKSKYQKRR